MIFDKLLRDRIKAFYWKRIDRFKDVPYKDKERIINVALGINRFVVNAGVFVFMLWFFNNMVFNRFGFERTIISLVLLLVMREWFKD